jgi:hypothetical protein
MTADAHDPHDDPAVAAPASTEEGALAEAPSTVPVPSVRALLAACAAARTVSTPPPDGPAEP